MSSQSSLAGDVKKSCDSIRQDIDMMLGKYEKLLPEFTG